jgi:hypothetical protein
MKRRLALSLAPIVFATTLPPRHAAAAPAASGAGDRVLRNHVDAFLRNDLDALMADFARNAVLVEPGGIHEGRERIRAFYRGLMRQFPTGASTIALDHKAFHGDLVYFLWHGKSPSLEVKFASDTLLLRGGRIAVQTFAGVLQPVVR